MNRRTFLALMATTAAPAATRRTSMGITPATFPAHRKNMAHEMIEFCAELGVGGCQASLASLEPDYARKIRRRKEELGLYLEIQTRLAGDDPAQFEQTVKMAKEAGATSLRAVCLGGRRYETFSTLGEWNAAVADYRRRIARSVPIVDKHRLPLGLENHKDWTVDQQAALLKEYSSEYFRVCLDTGNNISLLDDPMEVIEKLAPFTVNTHIKDMGVEEYQDGFLLSEVPFGDGLMDMKRVVDIIRQAQPKVHFSLEMITRDPLEVPCLTEKYWATFPDRNGIYLARTLRMVRANKPRKPLPRTAGLDEAGRKRLELDHVERCIEYARKHLGLV
jgi:sugar phosphate isomerase/epimerase